MEIKNIGFPRIQTFWKSEKKGGGRLFDIMGVVPIEGGGLLGCGWFLEEIRYYIDLKVIFNWLWKFNMKSLFSFDQHKTKLNFQFLYDQLGPLLAFPPFGPTEFPLPLTLVVNYPKK